MARHPNGPQRDMKRFLAFLKLLAVAWTIPIATASAALEGQLELSVVDRDTGKPLAVRVHLVNVATKKPVKPPGVPFLGDHFVFYDKLKLKLPFGSYQFTMERGPEYLVRTGHFTINNYADDRKTVDLKRFTDMASPPLAFARANAGPGYQSDLELT